MGSYSAPQFSQLMKRRRKWPMWRKKHYVYKVDKSYLRHPRRYRLRYREWINAQNDA